MRDKKIDMANGLGMIERIGRQVTSSLDLDCVLVTIVDAIVELTGAEEGKLFLVDETSGELFIRARRNFKEDYVRTSHLRVQDSLVEKVLITGKPCTFDSQNPKEIGTSDLIHSQVYMPINSKGRVMGVLGADNLPSGKPLADNDVLMLAALADYAAIGVENARLYAHSEAERDKLTAILKGIEDGVVVIDNDDRLVLINRKAIETLEIQEKNLIGTRFRELVRHPELQEVLQRDSLVSPTRLEIALNNGRVMNTQISPIEGVGNVVIMQDITHLKELERIKSDFVNTVSHDLRSPLTAILGYIELIDRVGPVNSQQKEFIQRVQSSVHSITALINDLLDLGRIEAGFDIQKDIISLDSIIHYSIDSLKGRTLSKGQQLEIMISNPLPHLLGNPIRLRQMVTNLLANAIKYTETGGLLKISAHAEAGQIILQISDNGPGIPDVDLPFIFDKFYRASNVPENTSGSGLGLAIVKSIVENHNGRIWVDSAIGHGTTFTVVLPTVDKKM